MPITEPQAGIELRDLVNLRNLVNLRELVNLPGRVQSIFFRQPLGDESTAARRHAVVTQLAEQGAGAGDLRAVDDALCDVRAGRGAVALFLSEGAGPRLVTMPGAEVADQATCSALPNVLPLLGWRQANPAHVLAVVDRAGGDVTVCPAGGGAPRVIRVEGPDDEIAGNAPNGESKDDFHHRVEDSWRHNALRDAEAITAALKDSGARVLLLAGDVRTVGLVTDRLPSWIRDEVTVRKVSGSRGHDGSGEARTNQIAQAVAEAVEADTRRLLEEFADHSGPDGLAVQGAPAVLHALARGRVRTLLVTDTTVDERVAWFGDHPTELSGHRTELERLGVRPRHGRLVDAAVRAAILTDADIRVLRPGTDGAPAQGLGALCRFR